MCNWQPIHSAPWGRDLQLSVIEDEVHALAFRCRRSRSGWISDTGRRVDIDPSHWRDWGDKDKPAGC